MNEILQIIDSIYYDTPNGQYAFLLILELLVIIYLTLFVIKVLLPPCIYFLFQVDSFITGCVIRFISNFQASIIIVNYNYFYWINRFVRYPTILEIKGIAKSSVILIKLKLRLNLLIPRSPHHPSCKNLQNYSRYAYSRSLHSIC